jgi:diguanylate cyclase (GGDEF)-like protein/putative nucleotidyltransferase with HDIG domain
LIENFAAGFSDAARVVVSKRFSRKKKRGTKVVRTASGIVLSPFVMKVVTQKNSSSSENAIANLSQIGLSGAGALVFVWALFNCLSIAPEHFGLFLGLILLTFVAGLLPIRILETKTSISAADGVVFLTLAYIGVPAAVIAAVGGAFAERLRADKSVRNKFTGAAISALTAFAAGQAFYYALHYHAKIVSVPLHNEAVAIGDLARVLALAALVHFLVGNLLTSAFLAAQKNQTFVKNWMNGMWSTSWSCFVGALAAGAVQYAEAQWSIVHGILTLPLVALPYVAYKLHFRQLNNKNREIAEINRVQRAAVQTLAAAVDAREQTSPGHTRRVQIYAVGLARAANLRDEEIKALEAAALLHDIGKLAVPDYILNKPGKLSRPEMDKVKIHVAVGAEILSKVGFPYPVVPAVLYHHECWNGEGYPEGLRGEEIPTTARILSIADAYSSMREERPYREALSREDARRTLLACAGTQLDPRLVDVFLRHLNQFENEIRNAGIGYEDSETPEKSKKGAIVTVGGTNLSVNYFEEIKRANREVFALYDLARVSSSSLNLQETVSFFVEKVQQLVPLETCIVYLYNEQREMAVAAHVVGKNAMLLRERLLRVGEGISGYVLKNQKTICSVNPTLDFPPEDLDIAQDYKTMAALPLKSGDKIIGVISVYSEKLIGYEEEHLRLLETVSHIAANAIWRTIQHAETESRALTDPMTGLPNARSLQLAFEREIARASRTNRTFQVVMFDLDDFKLVNDTFGHKVGDLVLKEVSRVMRAQLREYDFLARYAGDEFVAIVPETAGFPIEDLCRRIEQAVLSFNIPMGKKGAARVGISIGTASYPHDGETLDQVLIAADQQMYSVKAAHKRSRSSGEIGAFLDPLEETEISAVVN